MFCIHTMRQRRSMAVDSNPDPGHVPLVRRTAPSPTPRQSRRWSSILCSWQLLVVIVVVVVVVHWSQPGTLPSSTEKKDHNAGHKDIPSESIELPKLDYNVIDYTCPSQVEEPPNVDVYQKESYSAQSREIDVDEFMTVFRQVPEFDNWGHSYHEIKAGMKQWKSKHFLDLLQPNMTLYESACGIGLNLWMTLEVVDEVRQQKGLTGSVGDVTVYGNEYSKESTAIAQQILSRNDFPGRLGRVCQADSSNLEHVPDAVFDMVYTGYISALPDPLNLGLEGDALYGKYTEFCESSDPELQKMASQAQHRQHDWFRAWVGEMIRIAQPGAAVIVEQVAYPFCDAMFDWGGVDHGFWHYNIENHGWDIDPDSIEFEADTIFRRRYHVFMRKNK